MSKTWSLERLSAGLQTVTVVVPVAQTLELSGEEQ